MEFRIGRADHLIRQIEDQLAIFLGHAQEIGDRLKREFGRDIDDEVALAALDHRVDDGRGPPREDLVQLADAAGREALAHDLPQRRVVRWVHVQHHQLLARQVVGAQVVDVGGASPGRVRLGVPVHRHDVGMPGDAPERVAALVEVPVDRCLPPQHGEHLVRHALREVSGL